MYRKDGTSNLLFDRPIMTINSLGSIISEYINALFLVPYYFPSLLEVFDSVVFGVRLNQFLERHLKDSLVLVKITNFEVFFVDVWIPCYFVYDVLNSSEFVFLLVYYLLSLFLSGSIILASCNKC